MGRNSSFSHLFACVCCALLLSAAAIHQPTFAQDRTFSIAGSAGYGLLSLGAVDAKNASDVIEWANLGIPVNDFASVKQSPFFSGRLTYRYSRDFSVSVYGSYFSKKVYSSYDGLDAVLQLERSVGAADFSLGIAYYPAAQPYFFQWYLQANLGVFLARVTSKSVGTQATKPAGVVVMVPLIDTDARYKKTKTFAAFFVGADLPVFERVFLKGEAGYRIAQIGELDGEITRFGVPMNQPSVTLFDFSGFIVSVGVGIELW
jgi:hypothetical protein